jgi:peroxiredoxin
MAAKAISPELMNKYKTQHGETLESLSAKQPVLLVFLRHFGCTFCREAVSEVSELRQQIEASGTQLAFVHLADSDEKARKFFGQHKLEDVPRIGDPSGELYQAFGLLHAKWHQYFNYESIVRMLTAWLQGHWVGAPAGDVERMPGTFLIQNCEIRKAFRNKLVSDRPDYLAMAAVC